jgi:hypothetical protein
VATLAAPALVAALATAAALLLLLLLTLALVLILTGLTLVSAGHHNSP